MGDSSEPAGARSEIVDATRCGNTQRIPGRLPRRAECASARNNTLRRWVMSQTDKHLTDTPYKGLVPYSVDDALFFFGREADEEIITANLMAHRLTLLYGPSGVGKSSVLQAGVVYHLHQLARQNITERGTAEHIVVVFNS